MRKILGIVSDEATRKKLNGLDKGESIAVVRSRKVTPGQEVEKENCAKKMLVGGA